MLFYFPMQCLWKWLLASAAVIQFTACSVVPAPDLRIPSNEVVRFVKAHMCAVIVATPKFMDDWAKRGFARVGGDVDGGSATPISADGYFLTADHVLKDADSRDVYVMYGFNRGMNVQQARVVLRSEESDLALLHVPTQGMDFYEWAAPNQGLSRGTRIIHGGISTGDKSAPGKLTTTIKPDGFFNTYQAFKMNTPLQAGDSGGPVVNADGRLVGINSAVEFLVPMETAIFVESEAVRPNIQRLGKIINRDRQRNIADRGGVD